MKKHISFLIVMAIILSLAVPATADTIITTPITPITGMNELSVRQAINRYFAQRSEYLSGKTTIFDATIEPVQADEDKHIEKLVQEGITWKDSSITITSVEYDKTFSTATVNEIITFEINGVELTESVSHELRLYLINDNTPTVASDAYHETTSGFRSCAYVPPSAQVMPAAVGNGDGSHLCILSRARREVGYIEEGENITKYGRWIGFQDEWCGMFISYCAHYADVGCISMTGSPDDLYNECQQKHNANANNGSYTPKPGDLFFTIGEERGIGHVGIVEYVIGTTMYVIEGNYEKMVQARSRNINDSDLLYFGSPDYSNSSHVGTTGEYYDEISHILECENCGPTLPLPHVFSIRPFLSVHWYACDICGYELPSESHTYTYSSNSSRHWQTCVECNYETSDEQHLYTYGFNEHYHWQQCIECNYTTVNYTHEFLLDSSDGMYVCYGCGYRTASPLY